MISKLAVIEQCISNTLWEMRKLEGMKGKLEKLYEMRDAELKLEGIDKEEWIKEVEELKNGRKNG